ncbi:hypothetical protein NY08_2190 [Rhodococcus sp. B7740]|nr:hypothetical protein NY08_2190 [Rhodococcus sp. B7740]
MLTSFPCVLMSVGNAMHTPGKLCDPIADGPTRSDVISAT